jgi:hypothetical protein
MRNRKLHTALSPPESAGGEGMSFCDHDCFNCKFPDCHSSDPPTPWEAKIMRGAHHDWDMDIKVKNFETLLSRGLSVQDISVFLSLKQGEAQSIQRVMRNKGKALKTHYFAKKKAAPDGNLKAAQ